MIAKLSVTKRSLNYPKMGKQAKLQPLDIGDILFYSWGFGMVEFFKIKRRTSRMVELVKLETNITKKFE